MVVTFMEQQKNTFTAARAFACFYRQQLSDAQSRTETFLVIVASGGGEIPSAEADPTPCSILNNSSTPLSRWRLAVVVKRRWPRRLALRRCSISLAAVRAAARSDLLTTTTSAASS